METLTQPTAQIPQPLPLALRLDPLGHNPQTENPAQANHRLRQRRLVASSVPKTSDERAIHLQTVDRKPLQICQR